METDTSSCILCNEHRKQENIIAETKNFMVIPDISQLVEGYLLICTKNHFVSMSSLTPALCKELKQLQKITKKAIAKVYTAPLFFEHGSVCNGDSENLEGIERVTKKGGCCIDHAHIHAIPIDIDLTKHISREFKRKRIKSFLALRRNFERGISYLFYEDQNKNKFVYDLDTPIPSQYIRQIIAAALKQPNKWDWRQFYDGMAYENCKKKLKRIFRKKVFFAQAMDNLHKKEVLENFSKFKKVCRDKNIRIVNADLQEPIPVNKKCDKKITQELEVLSGTDVLFIDMSIPNRNYIGCIAELTHAFYNGVPSIVYVGKTGYEKRHSLKYHATHIYASFDKALEKLVNIQKEVK